MVNAHPKIKVLLATTDVNRLNDDGLLHARTLNYALTIHSNYFISKKKTIHGNYWC